MKANLILTNGKIHTVDSNLPKAAAIAIRDGRILAVGNDDDIKPLLAKGGEHVNLGGRGVTPGLVDAHVHFQWAAIALQRVDLDNINGIEEALARIAAGVAAADEDEWVLGRGWANDNWENKILPTAAQLDRVTKGMPAFFNHRSGHSGWANSKAMQIAGISSHTPNPPGGEIQRDENGQATGIFLETAMSLIEDHIAPPNVSQIAEAMQEAQTKFWQVGLVGVHDFDGRDCFRALQMLHANGDLGLRVYKNIPAANLDYAIEVGLHTGFGNDWLRLGGIKIFADGALGPRTALMVEPYEGEPKNHGIAVVDKEEMMAIASKASAHQLSVTVHAIGDKANHDILDVYAAVRQEEAARGLSGHPRSYPLRHRIEHVQILHHTDLNRLGELGIIASMQPIHVSSDMETADRNWGARTPYSYAWRTMLNSGAALVFGSDTPIEPVDPLLGIYAGISRRLPNGNYAPNGWHPEQNLTLAETIHAFTQAAAFTSGQENKSGSITPGKLADLTIYDRDLFATTIEEMAAVQIAGTVVGGEFKYRKW